MYLATRRRGTFSAWEANISLRKGLHPNGKARISVSQDPAPFLKPVLLTPKSEIGEKSKAIGLCPLWTKAERATKVLINQIRKTVKKITCGD